MGRFIPALNRSNQWDFSLLYLVIDTQVFMKGERERERETKALPAVGWFAGSAVDTIFRRKKPQHILFQIVMVHRIKYFKSYWPEKATWMKLASYPTRTIRVSDAGFWMPEQRKRRCEATRQRKANGCVRFSFLMVSRLRQCGCIAVGFMGVSHYDQDNVSMSASAQRGGKRAILHEGGLYFLATTTSPQPKLFTWTWIKKHNTLTANSFALNRDTEADFEHHWKAMFLL